MRFVFGAASALPPRPGHHPLGHIDRGSDAMAAPPVTLIEEPRSLDARMAIDQTDLRSLVYDEIDAVLTRAFGEKWQRSFGEVCRIDHRYLRRDEFLEGLLPPKLMFGILDLAVMRDPAPVAGIVLAMAKARVGWITDDVFQASVELYRNLRS